MSKPYFPPPPATTSILDQTKSQSKKLNFSFRPQHEPQFQPQSQFQPESQPQPSSILKPTSPPNTRTKRTRQFILLALLVVSFTSLILGSILAYCAALPHSPTSSDSDSASSTRTITMATINLTSANAGATAIIPNRRDTPLREVVSQPTITSSPVPELRSAVSSLPQPHLRSLNQRRSPSYSTIGDKQSRSSLVFYTTTLPLLTIMHTSTLLLLSLIRTPHQSRLSAKVSTLRIHLNTLSLSIPLLTSSALLLGWLLLEIFIVSCEIVGGTEACPVQIRGHRMGGVSGLSIGKVVLGGVVMIGYGVFVMLVMKREGEGKTGKVGFLRRARFEKNRRNEEEDIEVVRVAGKF